MRLYLTTLLLGLASHCPTHAQDPPPPPGGFPVGVRDHEVASPHGPVTLVDGARTELTVYYPHPAPPQGPPATGWPVVLLIHGGGGTHHNPALRTRGRLLAGAGYIGIAYDVRGDGATMVLNPAGFDMSEEARLRDMVEVMARAGSFLPPGVIADTTRLAVTGESMGGRHALRAAAWSGLPLPAPIAPYTHMPVIGAVAPRIAPLDVLGDYLSNGVAFNAEVATKLYAAPVTDPLRIHLLNEDYAAIVAQIATRPLLHYLPMVAASSVPMLITNVWDDAKHELAPTAAAVAALPPGRPVRTWWTTNGHNSAENLVEELANNDAIRRWFDHFLKGIGNGVTTEPQNESGYAPPTTGLHTDPTSHWVHALAPFWPPPGTTTTTVYLRSVGGQQGLLPTPPVGLEPGPVVSNVLIDPTYDIARFCQDDRQPGPVLAAIALDDEVFTGTVLPGDLELLGRPRLLGVVDCDAGDFYLTAALYAVAPNGDEKLITAGTGGVRGGTPGTSSLTIRLDDTACVVPGGFRLRLKLRNVALHDFPGNRHLHFVPCFDPSNATLRLNAITPARLELPARVRTHAFVTPRLTWLSASAGVLGSFRIHGGTARSGQFYFTLLGASGYSPGTTFAPAQLPLNFDFWTYAAAASPTAPFFPGFAGLLDGNGQATATLDLRAIPIPPSILGMRWTLAVLGHDGGGYWGGGPAQFEIWS